MGRKKSIVRESGFLWEKRNNSLSTSPEEKVWVVLLVELVPRIESFDWHLAFTSSE